MLMVTCRADDVRVNCQLNDGNINITFAMTTMQLDKRYTINYLKHEGPVK